MLSRKKTFLPAWPCSFFVGGMFGAALVVLRLTASIRLGCVLCPEVGYVIFTPNSQHIAPMGFNETH